jgi:hypothetical protein
VGGSWLVLMSLGHTTSLWASIVSLFASSIGCSRSVQMREQSINRGCMARLGCLLQWLQCCNAASSTSSDGVLGGFRPRGLAQRTSRIRCLALLPTSKRPEPSLPASPPSAPTPLHPLHLTAAPLLHLLYPTSRCHDHPPTSSSFQHLHLHIQIQNPHLYEIGACYAGRPRSQQFLIQLFAVTPTRPRREVPASWGPSLQAVPFLTVLCFRG